MKRQMDPDKNPELDVMTPLTNDHLQEESEQGTGETERENRLEEASSTR